MNITYSTHINAKKNHRDRRIYIERERESKVMCLYLCLLDKFKLVVFLYYRFNISWIRKTVLKTEIFLALFLSVLA